MDENVAFIISLCLIFFFIHRLSNRPSSPNPSAVQVVPESKITHVSSMFPALSTASIKYDLQRNGANVERTVEKVLRDGFLPEPPAGWFGQDNSPLPPQATLPRIPNLTIKTETLISRFGLEKKIEEQDEVWNEGANAISHWMDSLPENDLRDMKVKMVLEARRKFIEKDRRIIDSL